MDRNRFKTISFKVGDGSSYNYLEMALVIKERYKKIKYLCTDCNPSYEYFKLAENHVVSKAETALVESFNSSMRDMLARLNRKTKRFSKSLEMLRLTLVMFFNKDIAYSVYDY